MRFIFFAVYLVGLLQLNLYPVAGDETDLTVLFSQNHDEIYDLEGEDLLSLQRFANLLTEQGVNVLSMKRGEINDVALKEVDVLILSYPMKNLSEGEMGAVKSYVDEGGGLMVLGGQLSRDYLNPLLSIFGMEMGYDVLQEDGNLDFLLPAGNHEVFTFVDEFEYYHAPAVRVKDRRTIVYESPMFGENWALFASGDYGSGRVFVSGDADFANNFYLDDHDNAQLGLNIVMFTGGHMPFKLIKRDRIDLDLILIPLSALAILLILNRVLK